MFIPKFIVHYFILPILISFIGILVGYELAKELPVLIQQFGTKHSINKLIELSSLLKQNKELFKITIVVLISTVIATLTQRTIAAYDRFVKSRENKKKAKSKKR